VILYRDLKAGYQRPTLLSRKTMLNETLETFSEAFQSFIKKLKEFESLCEIDDDETYKVVKQFYQNIGE
jgi:hypothetical protein